MHSLRLSKKLTIPLSAFVSIILADYLETFNTWPTRIVFEVKPFKALNSDNVNPLFLAIRNKVSPACTVCVDAPVE